MKWFDVECEGTSREVYQVRADSPEDAMANWASGKCVVSESSNMEPVSAKRSDQ